MIIALGSDGISRPFVTSQQIREMYAQLNATCVSDKSTAEQQAQMVFEQGPEKLAGITPSSQYWGEFVQLNRQYRVDACANSDPARVAKIYADGYANSLTLADMNETIAYYSSPAGCRFLAGHNDVGRRFMVEYYASYNSELEKADARFADGWRRLLERYKANPK